MLTPTWSVCCDSLEVNTVNINSYIQNSEKNIFIFVKICDFPEFLKYVKFAYSTYVIQISI